MNFPIPDEVIEPQKSLNHETFIIYISFFHFRRASMRTGNV